MESTKHSTSIPSSNPPSVEVAYKRKCIALKKRLTEIETENELMRLRNRRGWQYIQKMRLESCILLERLAKVTGMAEEAQSGVNPELRARAAALMSNTSALNGSAGDSAKHARYYEDETEGSSDEQPPTPQERPLRVKRSRKSNVNDGQDDDGPDGPDGTNPDAPAAGGGSSSLPRLAPAPSQEEMTSSFRIQTGSNGSANEKENKDSDASDRGSHNPEPAGARDRAEDTAGGRAEQSTTPMDMDAKEPKEES
ncbi:non-histone protein [Aspergillus melleus]|uniref:Non-histone protein n=1 Tax=Aspergillus melleus TaxID=138277 RepID=A0ACC3APK9_9EURO|nr:non-histone protein [Aspergillus melleus]